MKYEKYDIKASGSFLLYTFYSEGPKGLVAKAVNYEEIAELLGVFNLSFGDLKDNGDIDDLVVTDNKDGKKVLATVASTIQDFLLNNPGKIVHITGSSPSRIRLYRMAISNNLEELEKQFTILGNMNDDWVPFERHFNYNAFLVASKSLPL